MKTESRLLTLLEERGISQKQLARDLCLAPSTINGYIQTGRLPNTAIIIRLAEYFNTSTDYLLGLTDAKDPELRLTKDEYLLIQQYRKIPSDLHSLYLSIGQLFILKNSRG